MHLSEYLDTAELAELISRGHILESSHESLPLRLYSYTKKAQFAGEWSDVERKCRGLVVEDTGQIIAWCMPKFFNYSEHANGKSYAPALPDDEFEIFAKMDGSMGTVFFYDGDWHVASKGSFHSDQAKWATAYLRGAVEYHDKGISKGFDPLDRFSTYVCEIIYPENRIVVDYDSLEDLVLITAYDQETGDEWTREGLERRKLEWGWVGSVAPRYEPYGINVSELQELADANVLLDEDNGDRSVEGTDFEGYVVRFRNGMRCKVKLSSYLRLHKILTNCTERSIWESLSSGGSLDSFLENVPDEFRDWVNATADRIQSEFDDILEAVHAEFLRVADGCRTYVDVVPLAEEETQAMRDRKIFAEQVASLGVSYPSACFLQLDGRRDKLEAWAWKQLRPSAAKPFAKEEDV